MAPALQHRRRRAPREHGQLLAVPPMVQSGQLLRQNLSARHQWQYDLQGRSLGDLIHQTHTELVDAALAYTREYRNADLADRNAPIVMAGHQPQFFHAGVWIKNFALDAIARNEQAIAVNLTIDNDNVKPTSIRVPGGSVTAPTAAAIPYDAPGMNIPLEERTLIDRSLFASFGSRVAETIGPYVDDPLIKPLWPLATERAAHCDNLGECLAQARHGLEEQLGLNTLELPLSRACSLEGFGWLVCHILAHLPRFWEIHNDALRQYRREAHVRSAAHPVPDLSAEDNWLEAPFWIWRRDDPHRRRLFAKQRGEEIVLTDREQLEVVLPLSADVPADRALARLEEIAAKGIRVRPRALTTTMFARLLLGDLFVHGIGGAKYDELTDRLIERFFGLSPPAFLTLSATLHLPIAREKVSPEDARCVERRLRQLTYQPERQLNGDDGHSPEDRRLIQQWIDHKWRWIDTRPTPENVRTRHREIVRANAQLQPWVSGRRAELLAELGQIEEALRRERLFSSREYAFCLFSRNYLPSMLREMVRRIP